MTRVLLLLAGTREARDFAVRFQHDDMRLVASLAGVTRDPFDYPCETRIGGFGGVESMAAWLRDQNAAAVIDATHPFAEHISANAVEAARLAVVAYLMLRRSPWLMGKNSREFNCLEDAVAALPAGARAFMTTGRGSVDALAPRGDVAFILRSIEPVLDLTPQVVSIIGRPPFSIEDECAFMRSEKITHLVTKNSGGAMPAKLEAAEQLDIPVFSVAMPPPPFAISLQGVDEALAWAARL